MITDGQARKIASEWHGGQSSPLYSLASTGAINLPDVLHEIMVDAAAVGPENSPGQLDALVALDDYVHTVGARGPVTGWSDIDFEDFTP